MSEPRQSALASRQEFASSAGAQLRRARNSRGWTLKRAALVTKLTHSQLRAIEDDDFGALPGPTFARGFVRSYGAAVGLDPDELTRSLPHELQASAPTDPQTGDDLTFVTAVSHKRWGLLSSTLGLAAVLIPLGMLLAAWWLVSQAEGRGLPVTAVGGY